MRKIANILCLLEIVALVVLPIVAWVYNVLGLEAENPFSADAIRWLFTHLSTILVPRHVALLVLAISAIGALQYVGLIGGEAAVKDDDEYEGTASNNLQNKQRAKNLQKARVVSLVLLGVIVVLLCLPLVLRSASLLSVTGSVWPSPWLAGFPVLLCMAVVLTALVFGTMTSRLGGLKGIPRLLAFGLSHYGIWVVLAMMGGLIYNSFTYFF